MNVEVKDPLQITAYPSTMSLYPGQTRVFNVTVQNSADVNYSVLFIYVLDNLSYQETFVTFKEDIFIVAPGQQDLETWIAIAPEAPAQNSTLTIELQRVRPGSEAFFDNFKVTPLS